MARNPFEIGISGFGGEKRKAIPKKILRTIVYKRDKGRCYFCRKKVDPMDWELGRKRAGAKGGKYSEANCFVVCSSCNKSQGTLTPSEVRRTIGRPKKKGGRTKKKSKGKKRDTYQLFKPPKFNFGI